MAVGAVVCLIDTEGAKPEGSDKSEGSTAEVAPAAPVAEAPKAAAAPAPTPAAATRLRHMLQGHSSCKKILDEKI
jgi:2-oxoglutarate dehydrogenase E2 component (dihydrolipoamide succinyltransferase)